MAPAGCDIGIHLKPEGFRWGWAVAFYTRSSGVHRFQPSSPAADDTEYRQGIEAGLVLSDRTLRARAGQDEHREEWHHG
jgi:hypothetical protein